MSCAFSLEGELLDDRRYVVGTRPSSDSARSQRFPRHIEHEIIHATIFNTGTMFVAEDDTAFVEFFNLTDGKVSFEHGSTGTPRKAFFVDEAFPHLGRGHPHSGGA